MFHQQRTAALVLLISMAMIAACGSARGADKTPTRVELRQVDGGWKLFRAGEPYLIKGVGGPGSLKLLAECGGNSVRTWGADEGLDKQLDEAHRLGLTVTVGLWLEHERHGFDYSDAKQVAEQLERCRKAIERYKDHPAVLMWGVGNEMEGYEKGGSPAIWKAVNDLAVIAKQLDPNHPTMTVVAEIGGERVPGIQKFCPAIDIVGINSYGGGASVGQRYREAGGTKPFVITEFGPVGFWETSKSESGAPLEMTSTAKADFYRKTYVSTTTPGNAKLCLGSYAFIWGVKHEATATWFGMLLDDNSRTGAVDALTELWSGKAPANRCPEIQPIKLGGEDRVAPGAIVHATVETSDPEHDALKVEWQLHRAMERSVGGDRQSAAATYPQAIVRSDAKSVEVHMPKEPGIYRLFAFVRDGHGGAAVANVPIEVR